MGDALALKGREAYERGEFENAMEAFIAAHDESRQSGDQRGEATALMHMGVTHQRMERPAEAQQAYEEALALFEVLDDDEGRATVLGNMATLLKRQGSTARAESLLEQAADLFGKVGKQDYQADTLRLLAQLQLRRGAWFECLVTYYSAMELMPNLTGTQIVLQRMSKIFLQLMGIQ
jgi:tetratricopeptide (TPR) repeat protein